MFADASVNVYGGALRVQLTITLRYPCFNCAFAHTVFFSAEAVETTFRLCFFLLPFGDAIKVVS